MQEGIIDEGGSRVVKHRGWVKNTSEVWDALNELLPLLTHDRGKMFGREWVSKRLTCTIATTPGVSYKYSSVERTTLDTTFSELPELDALRVKMEALCGHALNFVFINYYRPSTASHPDDQLGYHSDDDSEMVPGSSIVSVSLGDTRHFAFRRKGETKMACQTALADGDVVLMCGETQSHFEHAITTRGAKQCTRGRWNLTFRQFKLPVSLAPTAVPTVPSVKRARVK